MRRKAGERLFEAIGQLPEEMILEAEKDGLEKQNVEEIRHTEESQNVVEINYTKERQSVGELRHTKESQNVEELRKTEKNQNIEDSEGIKNREGNENLKGIRKTESSQNVEELRKTEKNQNIEENQKIEKNQSVEEAKNTNENQNAENTHNCPGADSARNNAADQKSDHAAKLWQAQPADADDLSSLKKQKKLKKQKWSEKIGQIGGYLKYLPVAACLCLVCSGVIYIVDNYVNIDKSAPFSATSGSSSESGGAEEAVMNDQEIAENTMDSEDLDMNSKGSGESGLSGGGMTQQPVKLPVRNDAYEGPVLSMTATGDTHNIKTKRWIKGVIDTEESQGTVQPLLSVRDTYEIENNSKEDKTLQLVYPFVTTLNLACDLDGEVIQTAGEDEQPVSYNIGDSVWAYLGLQESAQSTAEDYKRFLETAQDYQEHALEKEVDWSREVSVYTFTDIYAEADEDGGAYPGVIGVTVKGTGADVLTYGFDHSFATGEGVSNHCFFIPEESRQIVMIVTGEMDGEPEMGFYTNLDCEERVDGITCDMQRKDMSYADALRLCSRAAYRQVRQDYETGAYEGELPEYLSEDAVFKALTAAGDEDTFYEHITNRYHTEELREIYEKLLGEVRIVYAMAMVTIPAGQSVRVEALAQKRQYNGHFMLLEENSESAGRKEYQFDFMTDDRSRLNIEKTVLKAQLPPEWDIIDENMKLKKRGTAYRAVLEDKIYFMVIKKNKQK